MPTTLLFVRHAQGTHNLAAEKNNGIYEKSEEHRDAKLTAKGYEQIKENQIVGETFDAIYCSPMRRTRHTLLGIYPQSEMLPVILDDRLIEQPCGENPSDKRLDKSLILNDFPKKWIHTAVSDIYECKIDEIEDKHKIISITQEILRENENKTVLIVGHGTWIHRWLTMFQNKTYPRLDNCKSIRITLWYSDFVRVAS
jgi:broad specificity phosphatase PhoE